MNNPESPFWSDLRDLRRQYRRRHGIDSKDDERKEYLWNNQAMSVYAPNLEQLFLAARIYYLDLKRHLADRSLKTSRTMASSLHMMVHARNSAEAAGAPSEYCNAMDDLALFQVNQDMGGLVFPPAKPNLLACNSRRSYTS